MTMEYCEISPTENKPGEKITRQPVYGHQDLTRFALFSIMLLFVSALLLSAPARAECLPADSTISDLPDYACFTAAQASSVYSNPTIYRILRTGKKIGKHTIRITGTGQADSTRVEVVSRIRVTVLKVPVFSFDYRSIEDWQDGSLISVEASTTENAKTTKVSATRNGDSFVLRQNGSSQTVTGLEFSSNHWHPGVLGSKALFNTLTGKKNDVQIEKLGSTQLALPPGNINATHFRYTGSLEAEVWYDDTGRWVQLRFENDDGSEILYQLDKQ